MAKLPTAECGVSDELLVQRAQAVGVGLFSVTSYIYTDASVGDCSQQYRGSFIFGFGGLAEEDIVRAITRLRPLLFGD